MQIGVIGKEKADQKMISLAYETGKQIATNGHVLICGGRGGVMEAAAKGAKENNGTTVGILPSDSHSEANDFIDIKIATGIGLARNVIVVLSSDVVIAVGGGCGTLSEIGLAWAHYKKIIAISTSGGWAEKLAGTQIDSRRDDYIISAKTPKEAVELATLMEKN